MAPSAADKEAGGRWPKEAIRHQQTRSADCERRVRKALTKLIKTKTAFTVEDVCTVAGVGKTFIYDKRRPALTEAVLMARDQSQSPRPNPAEHAHDTDTLTWRERALNAEGLARSLRATVKQREAQIADLTGQLYDPDGSFLADQIAELRERGLTLSRNLARLEAENAQLRRSLEAARANVKRERERNVNLLDMK